ncbi:hypothetical protein K2173_027407 [Erythroxylum novogranatense]|uniref:Uncharacterized protein n=1 Tax=Erythroxylum novogranatense TaxID=1862640 RepID=A0AAV8U2G0_9ROSI|nr:hypothetical protein K2173_027407 [Erythroxylum novogranatense]
MVKVAKCVSYNKVVGIFGFTVLLRPRELKVGMAENLRDFVLTNSEGKEVKGEGVLSYDGTSAAYALCPTETSKSANLSMTYCNYIVMEQMNHDYLKIRDV